MKGYTIQHSIDLLEKAVAGGATAADVSYDNTSSHMTADDVQEAIDELNTAIESISADDVSYDNTGSGLSATDVQAAINEVNSKISSTGYSSVVLEFTGLSISSSTPEAETIEAIPGDIVRIGGAFLDSGSYYAIPEAGIRVNISGTTCTFSSSGASTWSGDATLIVDYVPTPVEQSTRTRKKKKEE